MPQIGKLSFNENVDWSVWSFKDFEATFAGQIAVSCNKSVEEIAELLGIKVPKKRPKDENPE